MDDESVSSGESSGDFMLVRVRVPELNMEKCLQFQRDELIWEVKQQTLAALPKVSPLPSYVPLHVRKVSDSHQKVSSRGPQSPKVGLMT